MSTEKKEPEHITVRIDLGNDAMKTRQDVAEMLIHVMRKMVSQDSWDAFTLKDTNGNTVCSFQAE